MEEILDHSMEEIRKVAQVCYKAMPKKARKLAKEFFKKMDDNGDGKKLIVECISLVSNVLAVTPRASVFTLPVLAVESMFTSILISWSIMLCLNPSDTMDCLVEIL
ncbi:hypothetical protein ACSBR2_008123 [Camellia fascicularis]